MTARTVIACSLVILSGMAAAAAAKTNEELNAALAQVEELNATHRYAAAVELLAPFEDDEVLAGVDEQKAYTLVAELGRAYYHLGRYHDAYSRFRTAVAMQPRRIETALYLQACAWITGRRDEALAIFREVVRSGAPDLYLAMTMPGERDFVSDPTVWAIVEQHAQPINARLRDGSFVGVRPGQSLSEVEQALGTVAPDPARPVLSASAGPQTVWAFRFSADKTLDEITIHAEHLLRYTPYRLRFEDGLDWTLQPEAARTLLGEPFAESTTARGDHELRWKRHGLELVLLFGEPEPPRPALLAEGHQLLRVLTLARSTAAAEGVQGEAVAGGAG